MGDNRAEMLLTPDEKLVVALFRDRLWVTINRQWRRGKDDLLERSVTIARQTAAPKIVAIPKARRQAEATERMSRLTAILRRLGYNGDDPIVEVAVEVIEAYEATIRPARTGRGGRPGSRTS